MKLDCGHDPTAGYAIWEDGTKNCYDCTDRRQRADLLTCDKFSGYLSEDGTGITTWTGGLLFKVVSRESPHNMGGTITHWRGVDEYGQHWYGKGAGRGICTNMHKAKVRVAK